MPNQAKHTIPFDATRREHFRYQSGPLAPEDVATVAIPAKVAILALAWKQESPLATPPPTKPTTRRVLVYNQAKHTVQCNATRRKHYRYQSGPLAPEDVAKVAIVAIPAWKQESPLVPPQLTPLF